MFYLKQCYRFQMEALPLFSCSKLKATKVQLFGGFISYDVKFVQIPTLIIQTQHDRRLIREVVSLYIAVHNFIGLYIIVNNTKN